MRQRYKQDEVTRLMKFTLAAMTRLKHMGLGLYYPDGDDTVLRLARSCSSLLSLDSIPGKAKSKSNSKALAKKLKIQICKVENKYKIDYLSIKEPGHMLTVVKPYSFKLNPPLLFPDRKLENQFTELTTSIH